MDTQNGIKRLRSREALEVSNLLSAMQEPGLAHQGDSTETDLSQDELLPHTPDPLPFSVGQALGNYRLTGLLGHGGYADVYLAEHRHLGTQAAIKIRHARLASSDIGPFLAEARTIAGLIHYRIVRVLDFDVEDNIPYLVMSYAPHGTLRQRHPRGARLPLTTILPYVKQVAEALQFAHQQNLIHRDIKPENLLIGRNDEVLLSDFGSAILAQSSRDRAIQKQAGTAYYMAPEQREGKALPASDQYALAVVVYEWICGERPFEGLSREEIATHHMNTSPPPLHEKVPTLPPAVEEVVLTALSKEPQDRFVSVLAFANALEQASDAQHLVEPLTRSSSSEPMARDPSLSSKTPAFPHIPEKTSTLPGKATEKISSATQIQKKIASKSSFWSISKGKLVLLIGLVSLIVLGSVSLFTYSTFNRGTAPKYSPILANSNSAMFGFDLQHTHFNPSEHILSPANVSHLVPYWANSTVWGSIVSSPVVAHGVVYVGSYGGRFYAFDAKTGATLWVYTLGGPGQSSIESSPAVANGIVYVGSWNHQLYALDGRVGRVLWTYTTGDRILSSPSVINSVVYVGSLDGRLYALDAKTGRLLWANETSRWQVSSTGVVGISYSSPAVVNGVVYVGSLDSKLYALDAKTGMTLWTASTKKYINSSPAVVNGVVYIGSWDGKLYAFNAKTGKALWTSPTGDLSPISISSPAVVNGVVYVGSNAHKLYAFDAATGKVLWSASTGDVIYSSPTVANGVIYVGSMDGKLYAFNGKTGKSLWTYSTGSAIASSPAVVNGVIYVGAYNDTLYAFHLPATT